MTRANPLRSRVNGNGHARFWRRASTGDCARLASGYSLAGRTLTLVLGQNATGKQLRIELRLVEALPHWVNHEHIRQCRFVKEGQTYSVVFSVERVLPNGKTLSPKRVVALDPNHKNFAYAVGSDGKATEIKNPYFLKGYDKRIDRLKSKRDKCKKKSRLIMREDGLQFWLPSRRWLMLTARLQDVWRERREQTKQLLYTVANRLYHDYDAVGVGDYVPHGGGINKKMRRAMNNRSLNGRFKHILWWVALRSGIPVEVREWDCPHPACACHHIRDENAARNGLTRTLKALVLPCSGRREVSSRRAWRFNGLGLTSGAR